MKSQQLRSGNFSQREEKRGAGAPEGKSPLSAVIVDEVTKQFDKLVAVSHLSLKVPEGSMYGLLGPNGAGKTTTIRMILNIIYPDKGDISILGQHISEDVKDRIGYLPEERGLYTKMKVSDLLLFMAEIKGVPKGEAKRRASYWLERLELADRADKKVEELSKGMQQKVQFIATVIHDPELIIFDEPFMGLDPINTDLLKGIMVELKKRGKTIVLSTHLMEEVERLCEHICLINKGRKVLDGRLSEIKKRYGKNTVVLQFEGDGSFLHHSPLVKKMDDYGNYIELQLKEEDSYPELLEMATKSVKLRRFEVVEPSLRSIFIERVKGGNG